MSRKKYPLNENSLGGRLRLFRESNNIKIVPFAKLLGISQGSLSDMENNKRKPSSTAVANLIDHTNINIHWLYTGKGDMVRPKDSGVLYNEAENRQYDRWYDRFLQENSSSETSLGEAILELTKVLTIKDKQIEALMDGVIKRNAEITELKAQLQSIVLEEPPNGLEERRSLFKDLKARLHCNSP